MKRFITYLYEYNEGHKEKNAGFVRVDIRGELANLEVCVRNYIRTIQTGFVYGLVVNKEDNKHLISLKLCEVVVQKGQCDKKISLIKNDIAETNYRIEDVVGIAICFEEDGYLASCWKDEWSDEISRGLFDRNQKENIEELHANAQEEVKKLKIDNCEVIEAQATFSESEIEATQKRYFTYKKIEPNQIRELKSSNWHLGNNSFLLHGVVNYGFLFLKKEVNEDGEKLWLGVPGYYEKQEMLMAVLFGFIEFEPIPKVVVDMEMNVEKEVHNIEKNQEPKMGLFGGWFVLLDK